MTAPRVRRQNQDSRYIWHCLDSGVSPGEWAAPLVVRLAERLRTCPQLVASWAPGLCRVWLRDKRDAATHSHGPSKVTAPRWCEVGGR
jgi:hypothetical protein